MGKKVIIAVRKTHGLRKYIGITRLTTDGIAIFLSLFVSSWIKFDSGIFPGISSIDMNIVLVAAIASIPFWWIVFALSGAYHFHWDRGWGEELKLVIKPVTTGLIFLFFAAFLISPEASIGRWIILIYYFLTVFLVFIMRVVTRLFERHQILKGRIQRTAIIMGIGDDALDLKNYLERNPALGYKIAGFVERPEQNESRAVDPDAILRPHFALPKIFEVHAIEEVLVTVASNFHNDILSLLLSAAGAGIKIKIVPDLFDIVTGHIHSTHVMGHPLMEILPQRLSYWQQAVKITMDYTISILVLLLFSPIWIIVGIVIKVDSKGNVFYTQSRVGKGGKVFNLFKFRSMIRDAEKHSGAVWADEKDERITCIGSFLRKSRIDEIPQLLNVIKGEMSIVGPRPERPEFMEALTERHPFYQKRLIIKPGITGWSQVKMEYDTDIDRVEHKLTYDFFYIENQSIFLDLEILARTIKVVLTGAGAH